MINIKTMKDQLKKWTVDLIGEWYKKIIFGIFAYLLSIFGILKLKDILQMPVPLWLVILISLSILFGCAILFLIHSRKSSNAPSYKVRYFNIGNYKWETKIYKDSFFEVEKYPLCIKHDLRFIFGNNGKYCPAPNCNNKLSEYDEFKIYESAKSIIENKVRNKDY